MLEGEWTEVAVARFIDELPEEATRRHRSRVLIDLRDLAPPRSDMQRFYAGEQIARAWLDLRVAAFADPVAITRFAENTAVNRGARFAIFGNRAAALEWLLGSR